MSSTSEMCQFETFRRDITVPNALRSSVATAFARVFSRRPQAARHCTVRLGLDLGRTVVPAHGHDIGISNLGCYSHGLMGYRTPNIGRLAREGMMFTDSYGEKSRPRRTRGPGARLPRRARLRRRHVRDVLNGRRPHGNSWPDARTTPFRSEKNTNWEGAFRVPMAVRWPTHIEAGSISNGNVQHHDWLPTFLAMAGEEDVVDKLKKGHRQDLQEPHRGLQAGLTGEQEKSPRRIYADKAWDEAQAKGWAIVDMKRDWRIIFPEPSEQPGDRP